MKLVFALPNEYQNELGNKSAVPQKDGILCAHPSNRPTSFSVLPTIAWCAVKMLTLPNNNNMWRCTTCLKSFEHKRTKGFVALGAIPRAATIGRVFTCIVSVKRKSHSEHKYRREGTPPGPAQILHTSLDPAWFDMDRIRLMQKLARTRPDRFEIWAGPEWAQHAPAPAAAVTNTTAATTATHRGHRHRQNARLRLPLSL